MCGIAGVIEAAARYRPGVAEAMTRSLDHRGPDARGVWRGKVLVNGKARTVALGQTRLSIIDLLERANQPMVGSDGTVVVYNGEIYNFRSLRAELEGLGRRFRTTSDTEVLLEAWREWGTDAFSRLRGMFAFALWDPALERLLLVRDRLGIKPLFYTHLDDLLLFGSELRALRRHPRFTDQIDRGALGRFLSYGYVCGPETIYQDVSRLMPGEYLIWQQGRISLHSYWSLFDLEEPPATYDEAVGRLESLLAAAVEERLVADVPLGAFLSGGIDSSMVVSLMREANQGPVQTFTIGFRDADFDEAPWARAVAEHLGTEHNELYVGRQEAARVLQELPTLYDEPFGDASAIPTTLVSRLAHRQVKVVLSGDGGDELLGGYSRYRRLHGLERALALPRPLRRRAAALARWMPRGRARRALGYLACDSPADAADRVTARFEPEVVAACCGSEAARPRPEFERAFHRAPAAGIARRTMFADARTYLVDDILVKLDRASMSTSLEARVPLLDHRVARYLLSLPLEMIWRRGETKAPLRTLLRRRLPERLLARPKSGFGFPVASLLGRELDRWSEHYLEPSRLSDEGILDPAGVRRLLGAVDRRNRTEIKALWHLLCFERWFAHSHRGETDP